MRVGIFHGTFPIASVTVSCDPSPIAIPDVILSCTKTSYADIGFEKFRRIIAEGMAVLSLKNGIDAVVRIGTALGFDNILAE